MDAGSSSARLERCLIVVAIAAGLVALASLASLAGPVATAGAQAEGKRVLFYTGTTGYRHGDGQTIDNGAVNTMIGALEDVGFEVDYRTCNGTGTGVGNGDPSQVTNTNLVGCRNAELGNPATFTAENLAQYDAIYLHSASDYWSGTGGSPGQLWNTAERQAIIEFVQNGGGIAAIHNSTDAGAGQVTWDWWDGGENSVVGTTMPGHSAGSPTGNAATVQVADRNHLSTRDLPDTYEIADEHYNYQRNVRGTHHVLATFDERTYNTGGNSMGQDHPISWCKLYDGDNVPDGTGEPKAYDDGRTWVTGMGHYAVRFTENGGDNELVNHIVGGLRWVAGEGSRSDCTGTVWSNFTRTTLVNNANSPIAIDVADDGKVFWTEIGPTQGYQSEGFVKMHDPDGEPNNSTTVAAIPTRADHGNSEDGVLGMSLEPGFDLSDPDKRDIYVYYSPRGENVGEDWPTSGNEIAVGFNLISRFTLNGDGTAFEPDSEQEILRVDKAKISGSPPGFPGGPTDGGPGHVGGASLVFDSEGNLYLGVGDDVSPNAPGHNRFVPIDHRAPERWDARKTSANSNDLRGAIVRIKPLEDASGEPGVDQTYEIPAGNMYEPGTPNTRPELYAKGFRQPFTVHADPENPGTIGIGEYCHDNPNDQANRSPAGVCEWNLVDEPAFHGWPFCVGNNSPTNTATRWNYNTNQSTDEQYDCSLDELPADLDWAPPGGDSSEPTNQGQDTLPGPAEPATIWNKYPGNPDVEDPLDFGNLNQGGKQPITGPIYRYNETSEQGAFPPYYDGSWLIANRGSDGGFWKEVRLREDNNQMLRVHDFMPDNQFGTPLHSLVIGSRFGPDGALYLARFPVGCCRNQVNEGSQVEIFKIESSVADECTEDDQAPNISHQASGQPHPSEDSWVVNYMPATLAISATDVGCAGVDFVEYRVNGGDWVAEQGASAEVAFDEPGTWTVEYRATDTFENESDIQTVELTTVEVDDTDAPDVTANVSGSQNPDGDYVNEATLEVDASDAISPITSIEYSDDGGETWVTETYQDGVYDDGYHESLEAIFEGEGDYTVLYRATDAADNTSAEGETSFTIVEGETPCPGARSDEFDGDSLDTERWTLVREDDGSASVAGGSLVLPVAHGDINEANTGPINYVAQEAPTEGEWSVETAVTMEHSSQWQHGGLMLWVDDDNYTKLAWTHNNAGSRFLEFQTETNGNRTWHGDNVQDPGDWSNTMYLRLESDGASELTASYSTDGESWSSPWSAAPLWTDEGTQIGVNAMGDEGTETIEAAFDYVRFDPDDEGECPPEDTTPPQTTATLDPPDPGPGGTYDGPVTVNLSATDPGDDGNGNGEPANHNVDAEPATWDPSSVEAEFGDQVTWHFPETAGFPHDVWLLEPGDEPDADGFEVTDGTVDPGGDPVSYTFEQSGTWTFICKVHSFVVGGQWTGMVGTVEVGEDSGGGGGEPPSGVAYTEYRINDPIGPWTQNHNSGGDDPFETSFELSADGSYTVEYRSVDNAGNEEEIGTIEFEIDSEGDVGEPRLRVQGQPKRRNVGPRKKQTKFRFRATNIGDAPTGAVRLCAKGPRKRVAIRGQNCVVRQDIPAGQTRQRPVQVRIKPKARGKVTRIKLVARGPNVENRRTTVRLRVRR